MATAEERHAMEDTDSWNLHTARVTQDAAGAAGRRLKRHQPYNNDWLENDEEEESLYQQAEQARHKKELTKRKKRLRRHQKMLDEMYTSSNNKHKPSKHDKQKVDLVTRPQQETVHGLMIDAGSTGSRLHIYEWEPRVLTTNSMTERAVSGELLSYPGTHSRWTDRLQPGLAEFGSLYADNDSDEALRKALAEYLAPLLDFAKSVLQHKRDQFGEFPIFLRATAGMRILNDRDRARVMKQVRILFRGDNHHHNNNKTQTDDVFCPFQFASDEQARVLSGEEEAIYDWTGVNFLTGDLLANSQGSGTVVNPKKTHGALDLGGGSTQIGFYERNEDIMANLFKLQIGQAKHWNVYAHSFLFYGMNEALHRFRARLAAGKTYQERLVDGIHDPCLPRGNTGVRVRTDIHLTPNGVETFSAHRSIHNNTGFYQAILHNNNNNNTSTLSDDFAECMSMTKGLLHLEQNAWCDFAHGDCSFAGIYQPALPTSQQDDNFGEFLAFSNYYHVWQFLKLEERSTLAQLYDATEHVCSLSSDKLVAFAGKSVPAADLDSYCLRSAYVFQLLHNGYGFRMNDTIRAVRVIDGHIVGWALGAMLYEINAMPWTYASSSLSAEDDSPLHIGATALRTNTLVWGFAVVLSGFVLGLGVVLSLAAARRRKERRLYEPVKDVASSA